MNTTRIQMSIYLSQYSTHRCHVKCTLALGRSPYPPRQSVNIWPGPHRAKHLIGNDDWELSFFTQAFFFHRVIISVSQWERGKLPPSLSARLTEAFSRRGLVGQPLSHLTALESGDIVWHRAVTCRTTRGLTAERGLLSSTSLRQDGRRCGN